MMNFDKYRPDLDGNKGSHGGIPQVVFYEPSKLDLANSSTNISPTPNLISGSTAIG